MTNNESTGDFAANILEKVIYMNRLMMKTSLVGQCFSFGSTVYPNISMCSASVHEKCDGTILQMVRKKDTMIQRKWYECRKQFLPFSISQSWNYESTDAQIQTDLQHHICEMWIYGFIWIFFLQWWYACQILIQNIKWIKRNMKFSVKTTKQKWCRQTRKDELVQDRYYNNIFVHNENE